VAIVNFFLLLVSTFCIELHIEGEVTGEVYLRWS
jgi:hypothetical protein